jgi:hypothetical protein
MSRLKFSILFCFLNVMMAAFLWPQVTEASSETLSARKGVFRLLSADIHEQDAYHFRTSVEFFQQNDLLKDTDESQVRTTQATLAFGYALLPQIHLSAHGGFRFSTREPEVITQNPLAGGSEAIETIKGGVAVTGTQDLATLLGTEKGRYAAGLSLWVNLEKITRFFKGPDVIPTFIFTVDHKDAEVVPFRAHANLGYRLAQAERYFDNSDTAVTDFDRFATDTFRSQALLFATGAEFPLTNVTPSLEFHWHHLFDGSFAQSPKWITLGAKGKPFTQKNIEVFGAVVLGLSTYKNAGGAVPKSPAVPLWNAVLGFGISQFGRRAGEVGVDRVEYETALSRLRDRDSTITGLQRDLEYNTIQGRVIDAETNEPLAGVELSIADRSDFKKSKTGDDGRFTRFFKDLSGVRLEFSKEGYETSSRFLALKPGEKITVDMALSPAKGVNLAEFAVSVTDDQTGRPLVAQVRLKPLPTGEALVETTDPQGQITLKVPEGRYELEITAEGYRPLRETLSFTRGRTVLRSFGLKR